MRCAAPDTMPVDELEQILRESGIDPKRGRAAKDLARFQEVPGRVTMPLWDRDHIFIKAVEHRLAIPNWPDFCRTVVSIYEGVCRDIQPHDGKKADYIPILAEQDETWFAVAITTVDGQRFEYGDVDVDFSLQSCCKPLIYTTAVEDCGLETVHRRVGSEPTGLKFNEITLSPEGTPHNPYVNAGAIACTSMVGPWMPSASERFQHFMDRLQELAGEDPVGFSQPVALCEQETAWRNNALLFYMTEAGVFDARRSATGAEELVTGVAGTVAVPSGSTATIAAMANSTTAAASSNSNSGGGGSYLPASASAPSGLAALGGSSSSFAGSTASLPGLNAGTAAATTITAGTAVGVRSATGSLSAGSAAGMSIMGSTGGVVAADDWARAAAASAAANAAPVEATARPPFEDLSLYISFCAVEATAATGSSFAATLANGGVQPVTGRRCLSRLSVKSCLTLMLSSGMYDFSGTFCARVGLPAKSGVSGLIYAVIPQVAGISVFSPPLDVHGNSVRGVEFFKRLASVYPFGVFEGLVARGLESLPPPDTDASLYRMPHALNHAPGATGAGAAGGTTNGGHGGETPTRGNSGAAPVLGTLGAAGSGSVVHSHPYGAPSALGAAIAGGGVFPGAGPHGGSGSGGMGGGGGGGGGLGGGLMTSSMTSLPGNGMPRIDHTVFLDVGPLGRQRSLAHTTSHSSDLAAIGGTPLADPTLTENARKLAVKASTRRVLRRLGALYSAFCGLRDWVPSKSHPGISGPHDTSRSGSSRTSHDSLTPSGTASSASLPPKPTPSSPAPAAGSAVHAVRATGKGASPSPAGRAGPVVAGAAAPSSPSPTPTTPAGAASDMGVLPVAKLAAFLESKGISSLPSVNPKAAALLARLQQRRAGFVHFRDILVGQAGGHENLVTRALLGTLVQPNFQQFAAEVADMVEAVRRYVAPVSIEHDSPGTSVSLLDDAAVAGVAGRSPAPGAHASAWATPRILERRAALDAKVKASAAIDASNLGVAICTVDGQQVVIGDAERHFPMLEAVKPLLYAIALEDVGKEAAHRWVGTEPTSLDPDGFHLLASAPGGDGGHGGSSKGESSGASTPKPTSDALLRQELLALLSTSSTTTAAATPEVTASHHKAGNQAEALLSKVRAILSRDAPPGERPSSDTTATADEDDDDVMERRRPARTGSRARMRTTATIPLPGSASASEAVDGVTGLGIATGAEESLDMFRMDQYGFAVLEDYEEFGGVKPTDDPRSHGPPGHPMAYNPFTLSGSLVVSGLIGRGHERRELKLFSDSGSRLVLVLSRLRQWAGGHKARFNNTVNLVLNHAALKPMAIAHFMKGMDALPQRIDPTDTAQFLLQCMSIELTASHLAVIGATVARVGACPITDKRCMRPSTVKSLISQMYNCGLNQLTGRWNFKIGVPAFASSSGAVVVVVPNVMCMVIYAPTVNHVSPSGVPARAWKLMEMLTRRFRINLFDQLVYGGESVGTLKRWGAVVADARDDPSTLKEPSPIRKMQALDQWAGRQFEFFLACRSGNLTVVRTFIRSAPHELLQRGDWDDRTPLHIAAAEGHDEVIRELLTAGVEPVAYDRWGTTPLDEAYRNKSAKCVSLIEKAMVLGGFPLPRGEISSRPPSSVPAMIGERAARDAAAEVLRG